MQDIVQYIMSPKIRYAPEIGTFISYDIIAVDFLLEAAVQIVRDVTPDRKLALRMVGKFNKYQLSPIHLFDAIQDMLN